MEAIPPEPEQPKKQPRPWLRDPKVIGIVSAIVFAIFGSLAYMIQNRPIVDFNILPEETIVAKPGEKIHVTVGLRNRGSTDALLFLTPSVYQIVSEKKELTRTMTGGTGEFTTVTITYTQLITTVEARNVSEPFVTVQKTTQTVTMTSPVITWKTEVITTFTKNTWTIEVPQPVIRLPPTGMKWSNSTVIFSVEESTEGFTVSVRPSKRFELTPTGLINLFSEITEYIDRSIEYRKVSNDTYVLLEQ